MITAKADILASLKKDLLPLEGFKNPPAGSVAVDLGPVNKAFLHHSFPTGAVHEFVTGSAEDVAATGGFIAGITSQLMGKNGVVLWISSARLIFPPALLLFGIAPDRVIFIDLKKEKDCLWAVEEALKCEGLAAVIGELKEFGFTASRRFQLAVEQSRVTAFIIRAFTNKLTATASIARWRITSVSSELEEDMPGVGFPRWQVDLLKLRNGKPGSWQVEWAAGSFREVPAAAVFSEDQKKTG